MAVRRADKNEIRATQQASAPPARSPRRCTADPGGTPDRGDRESTACTAASAPAPARTSGSIAALSGRAGPPGGLAALARDDHLYVREQEWEAAHTVWIWPDRSPSMTFRSKLAQEPKLERALVVAFALAEVLVHAGERVGVPGLMRPTAAATCWTSRQRGRA